MTIPFVDLHCHVEGSVRPDLYRRLAERNGIRIPDAMMAENGCYHWDDFSSFLKAYDVVADAVRTAEDYRDVIFDYYTRAATKGLIYGEVFSSPDHAAQVGLSYPDMVAGMTQGLRDAEASCGIRGRVIATCVRHLGADRAIRVAQMVADHPHETVVGFGMGGDERMHQMADFAPAFDIARGAGLQLTTHAGEICGPQSVIDALDHLKPVRIGHGVRSIESPDLVKRLTDEEITLEVCPGSNIALGIYPSYDAHPFETLRQAGCKVTLAVDDPPFFDTKIEQEYAQVSNAFDLNHKVQMEISKTAIEAAFCDETTKAELRNIIANS